MRCKYKIVHKKRRKVKGLGYMREMNGDCCNMELRECENGDICSLKSEKVS